MRQLSLVNYDRPSKAQESPKTLRIRIEITLKSSKGKATVLIRTWGLGPLI
jgi:hypothetical protein